MTKVEVVLHYLRYNEENKMVEDLDLKVLCQRILTTKLCGYLWKHLLERKTATMGLCWSSANKDLLARPSQQYVL